MKNAEMLLDFINSATTAYHTVAELKANLIKEGFTQIGEDDLPRFSDGGKHFVVRHDSSLIAFFGKGEGFSIVATHGDTPSFKIKGNLSSGAYIKLDTEKYGGAILYSWLDRPLSIAGRVVLDSGDGVSVRLVDLRRPVAVIPSVAIHQNRSVNEGLSLNPAVDMLPLMGIGENSSILSIVAKELSVDEKAILSSELFVYV